MDVPSAPELGGEDGTAAADAEEKEEQEEKHLVPQGDCADLYLSELADHDGVYQVEGGCHQGLQGDGQGEADQSWQKVKVVALKHRSP